MRIDPRRLAVLGAVAEAGGVLAAAPVLHLTPSAVSQHIARLEAETGVTLLDRSRLGGRRASALTPAGRLLARHADRVSAALAEAERDLAVLTGVVSGPVTVGAFPTVIRHVVAPAVAAVAANNPAVRVSVRQLESDPGIALLRGGALDLLIVERDPAEAARAPRGLRAVRLLEDPYRVAYPAAWAPVRGIERLLSRHWVTGPPGTAAHSALGRIAAHFDAELDRQHECLEFPAALAIVAAGLAAAVVPSLALPAGDSIEVLECQAAGVRRIDLLHRGGRHEPGPAARLVADAIAALVPMSALERRPASPH